MKKLLLFLLMTTSLFGGYIHHKETYQYIPSEEYPDNATVEIVFLAAVFAAKCDIYNFKVYKVKDMVVFKAYNYDSSFVLKCDRQNDICFIEFNAVNDSFNYDAFKRVIDSVFLYD